MYKNYSLFSFLVLAISLFVSCGKQNVCHTGKQEELTVELLTFPEPHDLNQMPDLDIPIPFTYRYISHESYEDLVRYSYEGTFPLEKTRLFYLQEMERLGWDIADFSTTEEVLLICTTPSKKAAISVRRDKKNNLIHITCSPH